MTNILKFAGVAIAGVVVGLLLPASSDFLGGRYSQVDNHFSGGLYAGVSDQFAIDSDGDITTALDVDGDSTVAGGTLTVATSNTATSTATFGCWQTYATSTASPIKYQATTTAHAIAPVFGTCPNL